LKKIKYAFIEQLKSEIPEVSFNGNSGDLEKSTYTSVNVCFPVAPEKSAMFLFQLDLKGIACSKGSACQSGSSQNSHVLTEILSETDLLKPSIRFSFSIYNTKDEVDYVVKMLKALVVNSESKS
jgi:cysteine desulfurase